MSNQTEMIELARRAVACDGWRWMEGMSIGTFGPRGGKSHFSRIQRIKKDGLAWCLHERHGFVPLSYVGGDEPLPDFDDAATRGCLLALVREVFNEPSMTTGHEPAVGWDVYWPDIREPILTEWKDTEAHALVAALEAGSR